MKNLIVIILIAIPLTFFLAGCADMAKNAEMMKQEMEKVTTAVDERLELLTDSLNTVCEERVDSIARMRISEAARKGTGTGSSTYTAPTGTGKTTVTQTPQQTKKDKMSGQDKTVTESDTKTKKDKIEGKIKEVTEQDTDKKKSKMKGGGN